MRSSLSLHLALYRRQKTLIWQAVGGRSLSFRAYESRYLRRTRRATRTLSAEDVVSRVVAADVVYVGDYHTLPLAQRTYLELVDRARQSGRRVVMALECVEGRHQRALERFVDGTLSEKAFLARMGQEAGGDLPLWEGFRPLLAYARSHRVATIGIDRRASGPKSLAVRDAYAAARIATAARASDRPLVMVLVGQYHATPCHLPDEVAAALQGGPAREHLVVYQNCEGVYWDLAARGELGAEAAELPDGSLCLMNTSPVICQQSFLDYLEDRSDDAPLPAHHAQDRFRKMARLIAKHAGVRLGSELARVEVATAADVHFLQRVKARGRFRSDEVAALKRHVLSRESSYIPRAKMAYLASLSLNHAAEEAAHFVRHCAVGDGMDAPRDAVDAFYARALEEAIGFFGSKWVNPQREAPSLELWAKTFTEGSAEERKAAAFVLAHKAAEQEGPERAEGLLPRRSEKLFHAVTHGLGYLLGEALYTAYDGGRLSEKKVRELFRDPFHDAQTSYFRLLKSIGSRRAKVRAA